MHLRASAGVYVCVGGGSCFIRYTLQCCLSWTLGPTKISNVSHVLHSINEARCEKSCSNYFWMVIIPL